MLFDSSHDFPLRSHVDYLRDYEIGTNKHPSHGIRKQVKISNSLNLPDGLPIDYMHLILLGMFKKLGKIYFETLLSKIYIIIFLFNIN
jgi:hypothetical protein